MAVEGKDSNAFNNLGDMPDVDDIVQALEDQGINSFFQDSDFVDHSRVVRDESLVPDDPQGKERQLTADEMLYGDEAEKPAEQPELEPELEPEPESEKEQEEEEKPKSVIKTSADYIKSLLSRKESAKAEAARKRAEEEYAAKRRELEEREAALANRPKPRNPIEALMQHGFTYEQAAAQVLSGQFEPEKKEVDPVEEKLAPVLSKLEEANAKIEELQNKLSASEAAKAEELFHQAKQGMLADIQKVAKEDKYELVMAKGDEAYEYINQIMLEYYAETKEVLDISDACAIVESEYQKELDRWLGVESVKSRFKVVEPDEKPKKPAKKPEPPTHNNSNSSAVGATPNVDQMSEAERLDYIANMLEFIEN